MKTSTGLYFRFLRLYLFIALVAVFTVGCAVDSIPTAGISNDSQTVSTNQLSGYKTLSINITDPSGNLDGGNPPPPPCGPMSASGFCTITNNNKVKINHLVEVRINRGLMPFDNTINIYAPSSCEAVADFSPHPFNFTGNIEISWKVKEFGLPANFDYSTLIPWYVDDQGNYVQVAYEWRGGYDELVVYTNHFSRYIISQRVS
jgi:hypothetical protein